MQEPEFFEASDTVKRIFGEVGLGDKGEYWKNALHEAHEKGFVSGELIKDIYDLPGEAAEFVKDRVTRSWQTGRMRDARIESAFPAGRRDSVA
ncbi:MAG: hypothetical protein MZV49_24360 [Rhodopseudomonas palustris]|nr:hypothetical protein [Rhodopseudomonas palustris]